MINKNISGLHYGKVSNNNDPKKLGRVKVIIEALGDSFETDWIPVLFNYSSECCGHFFVPEVDDQVVVSFTGHSSRKAAVLGSLWNHNNKPPVSGENSASELNKNGENNLRLFKSKGGNKIIMDDTDGAEKLQFIAAGEKNRIDMSAADESVSFQATNLMMTALKGISVDAVNGNIKFDIGHVSLAKGIKIESDTTFDLEALANLTMSGEGIELNKDGN